MTIEVAFVEKYEALEAKMLSAKTEFQKLSSKSPNDAVNKFKLKIINQLLLECNELLSSEGLPVTGFESFDSDELPTTSDTLFILGQYEAGLEKYRASRIKRNTAHVWVWDCSVLPVIQTRPPRKLQS